MVVEGDALVVDLDLLTLIQVVIDDHLATGADQGAPQFHWSQPVGVDVRNLAAFEKQSQIRNVFCSAWDVTQARCRYRAWTERQNVIHDREVVHREIPKYVHIVLKQAKVHAYGIVIVNFAQTAAIDQFANLAHGASVDKCVIDHEDEVAFLRYVHQMLYLAGIRCERLLDQHMLALLKGTQGQFVVSRDGSSDGYGVNRGILNQFTKVPSRLDAGITTAQKRKAIVAKIADAGDLSVFRFKAIPHKIWTPIAVSDDPDANQSSSSVCNVLGSLPARNSACQPCGNALSDLVVGNIMSDHRTGTDQRALTDGYPAHYHSTTANRSAAFNTSWYDLPILVGQ